MMDINFPDFSACKVLVVGDIMLDRYLYGDTSRISPEAPVPVVHVRNSEDRLGGAANVALNIAHLGTKVTLLGVVGNDDEAKKVAKSLDKNGIDFFFEYAQGLPTIRKMRVVGRSQQLLRLDFEEKFNYDNVNFANLLEQYVRLLESHDVVVLSDYAKGTLTPVRELIKEANKVGVKVLVDPKSRDLSIYTGATIVTPNWGEFEAVVGNCDNEEDIVNKGNQVIRENKLDALLVTRGAKGMSLIQKEAKCLHLPARAREVYDVTGAGDTVIATVAASVAAGCDFVTAVNLANVAAALAVSKLGTATVSDSELRRALKFEKHCSAMGVLSEEELLHELKELRAKGKKIVFTNGCFDILHPGHVTYLEKARALGDLLVIAVNTDDSVQRLKGPTRPINGLEQRMRVLAGLRSVDFVVPFSEDTPKRIIEAITPDVLVKGGDYTIETIVGHKHVFATGGDVIVIPFEDGFSTTSMINKINDEK